jgi:hypothetical protein
MSTRLHINLSNGTLDVEGSEDFVKQIYEEFKEKLDGKAGSSPAKNSIASKKNPGPKKGKGEASSAPQVKKVEDLDLRPNGKPSLRDYFKKFGKTTRNEKFLIYASYLEDQLGLEEVTPDHIFTCMLEVGDKPPKSLKQGLYNAARNSGWFKVEKGKVKVTEEGKKKVE